MFCGTVHNRVCDNLAVIPAGRVRRGRYSFSVSSWRRSAGFRSDRGSDHRGTSVWESHRTATRGPSLTIYQANTSRARDNAEIVSEERPKEVYNSNRIVRAMKLGANLPHARLRTCVFASSACKFVGQLAECWARISEILYRLGVLAKTLSTGKQGTAHAVNQRPVGSPRSATVRLPRAGVKIGSTIFTAWRVPGQS